MKAILFISSLLVMPLFGITQDPYPSPEFTNEVYHYRKDSTIKLMRLEKGSSKMETKTKMGGVGGAENGYLLSGDKCPVRLTSGSNLSFVYSVNSSPSSTANSDSMLRANGLDPATINGMNNMYDPVSMVTLYKAESTGGNRKIILMKTPGMMPFGSKKIKSSEKFTFSARKIREGYWELVLDKPLSKGEYAFTLSGTGMSSMDGRVTLFAFAVD